MYFKIKREKSVVKFVFKVVFLFAIFSSLPSCSVSPDEMVLLDRGISSYDRAIRWGDFARAKSFHKNDPVLSDIERRRLKLYRVTNYTVLQHDTPNVHNSYLLVEIKYYKNDRPVIKSTTVRQHWKRDEGSQTWYLDTPFPKLK